MLARVALVGRFSYAPWRILMFPGFTQCLLEPFAVSEFRRGHSWLVPLRLRLELWQTSKPAPVETRGLGRFAPSIAHTP